MGSMFLLRRLHLTRYCVSSLDYSLSDMSFLVLSKHIHLVRPLLLFPSISITITLWPTHYYSLLNIRPYYFNLGLLSCAFLHIPPTFVVPLILSFISVQLGDSTHRSYHPHLKYKYDIYMLISTKLQSVLTFY